MNRKRKKINKYKLSVVKLFTTHLFKKTPNYQKGNEKNHFLMTMDFNIFHFLNLSLNDMYFLDARVKMHQ